MNLPPQQVPGDPRESVPEHSAEIERLHSEYAGKLHYLAWAILRDEGLAADAVQEAFALLTERMPIEPAHRIGWLVKTVQYQALNIRKKRLGAEAVAVEYLQSGRVREEAAGYAIEREEETARLEQAIAGLPKLQRQVVQLRLAGGKSFAEIATELDVPLGTVLSRMRLALGKLRTRLK